MYLSLYPAILFPGIFPTNTLHTHEVVLPCCTVCKSNKVKNLNVHQKGISYIITYVLSGIYSEAVNRTSRPVDKINACVIFFREYQIPLHEGCAIMY